jgi:hypothetical protein
VTPPPVPDDQNFALTPIAFTSYGHILTREKGIPSPTDRDTNFVNRLKMPLPMITTVPTNVAGNRAERKSPI